MSILYDPDPWLANGKPHTALLAPDGYVLDWIHEPCRKCGGRKVITYQYTSLMCVACSGRGKDYGKVWRVEE